ncbi:insulinase family protein [Allofrancisella guangzhouensis]|uniref:Peptidase M16 n=1 Tax=Allofrancisella guangzhouensis TaxID=594679 RepID=A0A0A8EAQ0_9GAMM|nr:pitrilysin family protein [Allofrancisella guangzhouensis]AJC49251.1 peptidase M16 [Allofrancisella guangzhouensis]MBK2027693.1 insulinase family protein [Allofrancisella guangzhouensis]MBK2044893.1 insulinase family protein [Allofrancisella guangzhouensis]MBK2046418.1 insulinase family protein [Allofrancisella guangzhouensis]
MQIHTYSLNNGLNIYVQPNQRAPVVLSQIWYKVGSTYEPQNLTGISHMLEHMMFKGTDKYSKKDMNSLVENNGGIQNAFTSFDYTAYYQFWHKRNLELSLSLESSRMNNLIFDEREFIPERKVVLEERSLRVDDKAFNYAFEQFMKLAYQTNSRHTPIIGWREDIESYSLDKLKRWYKQYYAPNNASIVIVGDVDKDSAYHMIRDYFGNIPTSFIPETKQESSLINSGYKQLEIKKPPNDTSAIIMGYITPSLTTNYQENDPFALMILNNILGSADASILQQKLVRDEILCCHIDSEYLPFIKGEDIFIITAIANQDQSLENIQDKIENVINGLKANSITQEQLQRAKVTIKADKIFAMDSLETQANLIGSLASINLNVDYYRYLNKLYDVTIEDVNRVLNEYFNKQNLTSVHLLKD